MCSTVRNFRIAEMRHRRRFGSAARARPASLKEAGVIIPTSHGPFSRGRVASACSVYCKGRVRDVARRISHTFHTYGYALPYGQPW